MNSLNTYLLILENCTSKRVWQFYLKNLSSNTLYYEFDFEMPEECPAGEYNYYLIWNTYASDNVELIINNDILDSVFKFSNGQMLKLSDTLPETGIIKYIKNIKDDNNETLEYDKKIHFDIYER